MPGEYYIAQANVQRAEYYLSLPQVQRRVPAGQDAQVGRRHACRSAAQVYRTLYVARRAPDHHRRVHLTDAKPNNSPIDGTVVEFQLNNEGGRRFRTETAKHIQDYMAIVLDDRVMGRRRSSRAPSARAARSRSAGRDIQQAQDLALVLRAGALPVPLKVADVRKHRRQPR